jgi:hypothetical protein
MDDAHGGCLYSVCTWHAFLIYLHLFFNGSLVSQLINTILIILMIQ